MADLGKKREKILRNKDNSIDEKQLALELSDFDRMLETLQSMINIVFGLGKMYFWKKEEVRENRNNKLKEYEKNHQVMLLDDIK